MLDSVEVIGLGTKPYLSGGGGVGQRQPASSPPPSQDEHIRSALAHNDRAGALRLLVQAHAKELLRYCEVLLRDPALAADTHQAIFMEAFESLDRFEGRSSAKTWLFKIARHRCLDVLKRRRRWARIVQPAHEGADAAAETGSAQGELETRETLSALRECLERLDEESRELVVLRLQGEFTYEQLSEVTGKRSGALRVRFVRALPLIRRCLERKGIQP